MNISRLRLAIRDPQRAFEVAKYNILRRFGSCDYKKFIILGRSRVGSNLLLSFLNSHPKVSTSGEIFSHVAEGKYRRILQGVYGKQPSYISAKGFKIFYYHCAEEGNQKLWKDLQEVDDLHVIHLKRRNILRTLISKKIAEETDVWISGPSWAKNDMPTDLKRVSFSVKELSNAFAETRQWERRGDEMFRERKLMSCYYEELVAEPEREFGRVMDLLGLDSVKPETEFRKQNPEPIGKLLCNYQELKNAFRGSEWESFFEED